MFYNAKSLINYEIIAYGAKINLRKIEIAQRRIMRASFFKKQKDSITDVLLEQGILTVYEKYFAELSKELFRHIRSEAPITVYRKLWTVFLLIREEREKTKG